MSFEIGARVHDLDELATGDTGAFSFLEMGEKRLR